MEKKYYYGHPISNYGVEHGYVDYATLASAFNYVLNNDIISLTYDIGYWEQVSGQVDHSKEIEELGSKLDELVERNEESPSQISESEINEIENEIEKLEDDEYGYHEVFQYFIVDRFGADLLKDINEVVYFNKELGMYVWGVTHYGTYWNCVLTNIAIDW